VCNAQNKSTYIPEDLNKRAEEVADQIYKGTFKGKLDPDLIDITASYLNKAVTNNFAKTKINYNTPDWNMLANLEKNVYQFSAAKNYHQLKTMTLALKDDKGNVRSFRDYQVITGQVNSKYEAWLKTEYNAAIAGSQMASKWLEFDDNGMIQYRTAGDERVRTEHELLNNVIKPKRDPFWNTYYPPLGFGCRCTAIEVNSDSNPTPDSKFSTPKVPEMWRENTAKENIIFPDGHAYFKDIPESVLKRAWVDHSKVEFESHGQEFTKHYFDKDTGGYVVFHEKHLLDKYTGKYELLASKVLSKEGHKIILQDESALGRKFDGFLNDIPFEIKSIHNNTTHSIKKHLHKAYTQKAEIIVLYFPNKFDIKILKQGINRWKGIYPQEQLKIISIDKNGIK